MTICSNVSFSSIPHRKIKDGKEHADVFFCSMPSKQGPVLGRYQNGVCSMKPLESSAYSEIHHFETPTAVSDERA
jgi:hypothetical protein